LGSAIPSMPQLANSLSMDHLTCANMPPQKCEATVKCMPERSNISASDMERIRFMSDV